jgi:hypothetical protein
MTRWPLFRDVGLFVGGLAGVAHETLLTKAERPTLLILFAAMMGLPAFLRPPESSEATDHVVRGKEKPKEEG